MKLTIRGFLLIGVFLAPGLSLATPHPLEFEVLSEFAGSPPYPTNAIQLLVAYPPDDIKPGIPTELLSLSLNGVTPTPVGVQMQAKLDSDEVARIDFRATVPPDPSFPDTLFFDVFVDVAPHPDDPLAPVGGINPCSQPGAANFFDVLFDVELNSFASHLAHFEIAPGQTLAFLDPTVEPNQDGFSYSLRYRAH